MIEVAILDVAERILARSAPTPLNIFPQATLFTGLKYEIISSGDSTIADSLAQRLANHSSFDPAISPSQNYSRIWFTASNGKCVLFDSQAETVALDDNANRGFVQIIEDNSGAVWAQSNISFGLWRRTAIGTWTQVLTDTVGSTGMRWRASDNTYWYSSSSNNWYQIANGVATLTAAPTGTIVVANSGWRNLDSPHLFGQFQYPTQPTFRAGDSTTISVSPPILPGTAFLNENKSTSISLNQVRIDATYSLLVSITNTVTNNSHYNLYMMNKTTGVIRFIGCLQPMAVSGAVTATAAHMSPFYAKFIESGTRLYFVGNTLAAVSPATSGNQGGLIKVDIAYQPTF